MNLSRLAKIDLNLLVALHILLEEGSVSKAATKLSITQPAMSKTLGRLRETFDDPLFVRSKRGVQPTPRAIGLAAELKVTLEQIDGLLDAGEFLPASYRGQITLAISEYVGFTLLPPLSARLQSSAPKLRLRTITRAERQLDQLAKWRARFCHPNSEGRLRTRILSFPLSRFTASHIRAARSPPRPADAHQRDDPPVSAHRALCRRSRGADRRTSARERVI